MRSFRFRLLAAGFLWLGPWGPPKPAAKPLEITPIRVTHLRGSGDKVVVLGDLQTSPGAVRVNDKVVIAADLTVPAYYYLIAFNPKGSEAGLVQLCQPEGTDGQGAETVRPDRHPEVRYPSYFIPDVVGLQAFVVAASTKPLPPFKDWKTRADPLPINLSPPSNATWHLTIPKIRQSNEI